MAEIIGFAALLLCFTVWIILSLKGIIDTRNIKKVQRQSLEKQEEVEFRIKKLEDIYGEKAMLIMFQEFSIPNISELLIILEESQIVLIMGEAYNFSEILNLKVGQKDYIRMKHMVSSTPPTNILERTAAGEFSMMKISDALKELERTDNASTPTTELIKMDIMTSRMHMPVISITPTSYTIDEIIVTLSCIIDKNERKWATEEIPITHKSRC